MWCQYIEDINLVLKWPDHASTDGVGMLLTIMCALEQLIRVCIVNHSALLRNEKYTLVWRANQ